MRNLFDTMLTRREAFRLGSLTVCGYYFLPLVKPSSARAAGKAAPRGNARFVIFVMLDGGQSHVDSFDVKEGKWTPQDFDIRAVTPEIKLPVALYPKLAGQVEKLCLLRSFNAWDAVHGRAQYYVQAAHPLNPALQKEIPPIGSVVATELAPQRRAGDTFPPYVAMNVTQSQAGLLNSGFLPATYAPFHVDTAAGLGAFSPDPESKKDLDRRWLLLQRFDARLRNDPSLAAKAYHDYHNHYEGAVRILSDARADKIFRITPEDKTRYGSSYTGEACIVARNLVDADAGTRFIFLQQNGWDHHKDIYLPGNHYKLSRELDSALAALLDDLGKMRRPDGRTLLSETMVICMGEFGRTPGELTGLRGRDHYQHAMTVLTAGAGIKGGRPIGRTDEIGAKVVAPEWSGRRPIYMEDLATTIYSAMGIDWTKTIKATPSGREFFYVEPLAATTAIANREIAELYG
jgi:hypothetical protein